MNSKDVMGKGREAAGLAWAFYMKQSRGVKIWIVFVLLLIILSLMPESKTDKELAKENGFRSVAEMKKIQELGYETMEEYSSDMERLLAQAKEKGFKDVESMREAQKEGFDDFESFKSHTDKLEVAELMKAEKSSGLSSEEWAVLTKKLGNDVLLNAFRSTDTKDWPENMRNSYMVQTDQPKLLLKCSNKDGYYVVAHSYAKKTRADFLWVRKGQEFARSDLQNVFGTKVTVTDLEYSYPDYKLNIGYSIGWGPSSYRDWSMKLKRDTGDLRLSYKSKNVTYKPDVKGSMEYFYNNSSYECAEWDDVAKYQFLKSDYFDFKNKKAAEAEAKKNAEKEEKLNNRKF